MDLRTERLVAAWLATKAAANTRVAYERDLTAFASWCERRGQSALEATSVDLDAYRDECLAGGTSASTVTRRLSGIASFYRYVAATGAIGSNPVDTVDRPPPEAPDRVVLDDAELDAIVRASNELGPKTAALVSMLALDGMKLGEVLAVDIPRVKLDNEVMAVELLRRGRRESVAITPETGAAIAAYVAARRRGPLFLGDSAVATKSARLTRFGADFLIKRAAAAAGISKAVSASMLRRSYIDAAHRAGTPLAEISDHVGHREVRDTARLLEEPRR